MEKEDVADPGEATHQEVVAILDSDRALWSQAERIVGLMCGYEHIGGQKQDAGDDKPFDLRSPGDLIRIDVKTQQGNKLDVKKEKPGKQFAAWGGTNKRFIPLQLVLDSLSVGWYVVPGIPLRTAEVILDRLVTEFDAENPTSPFVIGRCLLSELRSRERYDAMTTVLNKALEVIEEHRAEIQAEVDEEHLRYVASTAENTLEDPYLRKAVLGKIGQSDEAMSQLGQSDEAMSNLAKSDEAMSRLAHSDEAMGKLVKSDAALSKLVKSDEAMSKLAQSDEAMSKLAQSKEAMGKLARSDEAMGQLAQSDEAMSKLAKSQEALANLMKAAKKDPGMRAQLLALLNEAEPDDTSS